MTQGELSRVGARSASEVCELFEIGDDARRLLRPNLSPMQYLDLLEKKKRYPAAIQFLAHALPKRDAVWWACVCARASAGAAAGKLALRAAEKWVADPSEENRRATLPAAMTDGVATAAGCAALAAFASGGSLAPAGAPPVPPAESATAQAVAGAIVLAASEGGQETAPESLRLFLSRGVDVARGTLSWAARG
jgi:uncharacterized protein DUF6931